MKSLSFLTTFKKKIVDVYCDSLKKQIFDSIFPGYDSGLRPVCEGAPQVNLKIGAAVRQMIDLVGHMLKIIWNYIVAIFSHVAMFTSNC